MSEAKAQTCLCLVFGLPASGKTWLCAALRGALEGPLGTPASTLCFDAYGPPEFTPEGWKAGRQAALAELARLASAPRSGTGAHIVLIEDVAHLRSMRYECVQVAREARCALVQLLVTCDPEVARGRSAGRSGADAVPPAVVERLRMRFEAPDPQKHPWEARGLTVDTTQPLGEQAVLELAIAIRVRWGPPLGPPQNTLEAPSAPPPASAVHAFDNLLRRRVGAVLAEQGACRGRVEGGRADLAARLNAARRAALEHFRTRLRAEEQGV